MARNSRGPVSAIILLTTVFIPPLGVFLLLGCGSEVLIAICLTILGWFPGLIYAVFLWLKAGGFEASGTAEVRSKRKAKKAQRAAITPSCGSPVAEDSIEPRQPPLRIIETVLEDADGQAQISGQTSRQKPMRRTMREAGKGQERSVQAVATNPAQPSSAIVAARTASVAACTAPKNKSVSDSGAKLATEQNSATNAAKAVPDEETARPGTSIALGRVLQTDDDVGSSTQADGTPDTLKEGAAEQHLRVPGGYESRPQSAAAPGTPGASAVVNPQISAIRAVKDVEVKDA
ncbi:protein of unknown function [Taphrina deformans PYCC 5710]|uniref:Stress response RCI peptide n=1 Tax=Taphrina deformans (strain PYCC 5710 / ATCC 11124 / CBS 356.35 / IMI 108563 / JCM 9778 / NBRC 8474) TaxID=1097556 RepID=R4XF78_TAPDE|nr:protein of unknown function [Taphrina deformans PYCC 5710]|eukprot:CCG84436.1 protein of unknown function [Taphrina deformans PYCC 5710]